MLPSPKSYQQVEKIRSLLIAHGTLTAAEIYLTLGISQAVFSRLVESMGTALIKIGRARKTRYALKRGISNLDLPIPLYRVSKTGTVVLLGNLHPLEPRGYFFESKLQGLNDTVHKSIPYFLEDMRPAGFLGRLIPRTHPELNSPNNILEWSAENCLNYWAQIGWDLVGDLILGEQALRRFYEHQTSGPKRSSPSLIEATYPELARKVLLQGEAGSSAGGEQPKFLMESGTAQVPVMVKFSPPLGTEISNRVGDLLICEHLAHRILHHHELNSSHSKIHKIENQRFLEIERFDRFPNGGRKGLISARALSLEFVGELDSWTSIGSGLLAEKIISADLHSKITQLEFFGHLIGNTDMHAGNLSFFQTDAFTIAGLTPVYDMLPMMYYPRQNQIFNPKLQTHLPRPEQAKQWMIACQMAMEFWLLTSEHAEISAAFKKLASENHEVLSVQFKLAPRLFGDQDKSV